MRWGLKNGLICFHDLSFPFWIFKKHILFALKYQFIIYMVKNTNEKVEFLGSSFLNILYTVTIEMWSWKIALKRSSRDKTLEERKVKKPGVYRVNNGWCFSKYRQVWDSQKGKKKGGSNTVDLLKLLVGVSKESVFSF